MEALGRTFGRSTHIRQLNLSRNEKIGDEGINAFLESIGDTEGNSIMESLEMLDLGASEIGSKGIEALAKLIIRCPRRSLSLTLTSNPLKAASCLSLSSIVCGLSRIKSLYLARCDIGDAGVEYLTASMRMKKCTGLDTLDLSYNGIGPKGAKNLASVFWIDGEGHFERLAELVLAGNLLGQDGVMHLGRSLAHKNGEGGLVPGNTTLEILDLTQTNCGNDGAVAIMRCSMLRRVRLFNNKLGDNGFDSLASELNGGHPTLEQLDIGGNNATKDAVIRVLDAVGTINTLIDSKLDTLEIGGNETDFDVEEAIKRVKSVRPELDIARDKPRPKQEEGDDSPPIQ
jgi:Ran GTPase-activating protein (RanGAP) involved in mRNA processing and transport